MVEMFDFVLKKVFGDGGSLKKSLLKLKLLTAFPSRKLSFSNTHGNKQPTHKCHSYMTVNNKLKLGTA